MGSKKQPQQSTPPKPKTPTFVLELPLEVQAGQAAHIGAHLEVGRQFYNALLSKGQERLRRMRADPGQPRPRPGCPGHPSHPEAGAASRLFSLAAALRL